MTQQDRIQRYRNSGGAAGFERVEVLVPPGRRDEVLRLAERLRREYRHSGADARLRKLYAAAVEHYGTRCFWNMQPRFSAEGLRTIVDRLKRYGDLRAWKLAALIEREMGRRHAA